MTAENETPGGPDAKISRRGLAQFAAAGAAATLTTPAVSQSANVLAEAVAADYRRDPARWGSADVAAYFPGFSHLDMRTREFIERGMSPEDARRAAAASFGDVEAIEAECRDERAIRGEKRPRHQHERDRQHRGEESHAGA